MQLAPSVTIQPSDVYSGVAILLTLAGLLGTFFSLQLTDWVKQTVAANQRWERANLTANDDQKKDLVITSFVEHSSLGDWSMPFTLGAVSLFVLGILVVCIIALVKIGSNWLQTLLIVACVSFGVIYLVLVAVLSLRGWGILGKLKRALDGGK